jgi:hypothetical protein
MVQKLTKFKVRKVSLVPWGANDSPITLTKSADADQLHEIEIFKSAQGDNESMFDDKVRKEDAPPETEEEKKKREEKEAAEKASKSAAAPVKKEDETEEEKKKRLAEEAKKEGESEGQEKKEEAAKSAPAGMSEAIAKAVALEVSKAVASLKEENVTLRKSLGVMTDRQETEEYIKKASTHLPSLGKPDVVGSILRDIAKSDMPQASKVALEKLLSHAEDLTKAAAPLLFKSFGYDGAAHVEESAAAEIDKRARETVKKSADGKMDMATARAEVRKQDPDLAAKERAEEKAARGGA